MNPGELMPQIPIYLKTADDVPRPEDPEFYWLTRSGVYLCRNHPFFESDAPVRRMPGSLAEHRPACHVAFPLVGIAALEYVVGFFSEVYYRHGAEAIVLVYWDLRRKRYRLEVPLQKARVWQPQSGIPFAIDVTYDIPTPLPRDHLLIGDIHSHADLQAYSSGVDTNDERHRDGMHVVVGCVNREPPQFHLEMTVDGCRFPLCFSQFFRGYRARRDNVPEAWLRRVEIQATHSTWVSNVGQSGYQTKSSAKQSMICQPQSKNKYRDKRP
jgi:hypothetical protein